MDQSTLITLYTYDARGVFSGAVEVDPMGEVPPGLLDAPPATTGAQVAQAHHDAWVVLSAYPPAPPVAVPEQVPMLDAHLVLIDAGYMPAIDEYLDSLTGINGAKARAYFRVAQTVRRDHELVEVLRQVLSLTHAQIDELFVATLSIA